MQKTLTKVLILGVVLTAALGVNYLFAAWTGPTQAPTGGNTSTPVHVGATDQVKNGGLSLDGLSVFGGGYFQGNVGVGVVTPTEALDVSGNVKTTGGLKIGNTNDEVAGAIRWTGTDFEGHNGTQWVSLVSGEAVATVDLNYTACVDIGGSWVTGQSACYFSGTSCPSGWSKNGNFSSTNFTNCPCSGSIHTRSNISPEICYYSVSVRSTCNTRYRGGTCRIWNYESSQRSCTAQISEVGCTKN